MQELADAVGIGERTLRSIERDERPDPRTIGLVEAYLGLDLPRRAPSPTLEKATDAELAVEVLRRLERARSGGDESLPEDVAADPGLILGPPDDPEESPRRSEDC